MQASFHVHGTALEPWTLDLEDFFSVNDTQEARPAPPRTSTSTSASASTSTC